MGGHRYSELHQYDVMPSGHRWGEASREEFEALRAAQLRALAAALRAASTPPSSSLGGWSCGRPGGVMTIQEAAHAIWERFQGELEHGWLLSIGIGGKDGQPAIVIYTRTHIAEDEVLRRVGPQEFPVEVMFMGQLTPLGGPVDD